MLPRQSNNLQDVSPVVSWWRGTFQDSGHYMSRGVGAGQVKGIKSGIGPDRNIGPNSETFLWDW